MKSLQFNTSFEAIALHNRTTQFRAVSIFHSQTSRRTDRTALACQLFHPKPVRGFVFRTLSGSTRSGNNLLRLIFCMTNFSTRFCCHHQFVFCSAQLSPVSGSTSGSPVTKLNSQCPNRFHRFLTRFGTFRLFQLEIGSQLLISAMWFQFQVYLQI